MIAVLQRVRSAVVTVHERPVASIGPGLLALVGVHRGDDDSDVDWMARKVPDLRVFADGDGRMNRSLFESGGDLLLVSQFTLLASTRRGRRPSFTQAMAPAAAKTLLESLVARWQARGIPVSSGAFGEHMQVSLVNEGPVTLLLDSRQSRADSSRG